MKKKMKFFKKFNTFHKNLKFTLEHELLNKLNFLDVLISKDNGQIMTSWYRKPSHTLLFNDFKIHGIHMDQKFIKSI